MAIGKTKKPRPKLEGMESLPSEVASFASSIGLASFSPTSGFEDSDFRKTGPMKPPKPAPRHRTGEGEKTPKQPKGRLSKPNPLEHVDPFGRGIGAVEMAAGWKAGVQYPKLPLIRASPLGLWHEELAELEEKVFAAGAQVSRPAMGLELLKRLVERKKEVAERLMAQYAEDYEAMTRNHGNWRLERKAARSGTTSDKVTALTTLVGDNPIANMKSLDILLGLVDAKVGKRYAFKGFDHLAELFKTRLLPDRKLKCLLQRRIDNLPESIDGFSLLLFWYWEECLKQRYKRFVIALEEASKDMLPSLKNIAMKLIYDLLESKMEQERSLLCALVNKLGDPLRKTASSAENLLSRLLFEHPNMQLLVIEEVASFIFRHVGLRAKYHAVNFLNQIHVPQSGGPKVAKQLVDIYFALFKSLTSSRNNVEKKNKYDKKFKKNAEGREKKVPGKKSEFKPLQRKGEDSLETCVGMDSRLLCALLTGVNRAFPAVTSDEADDIIEVQTPILFKLVHSKNFNVGIQALTLLYLISSKNKFLSDRFYRALYSKLLVPAALNSSKREMFLRLLSKAMKSDLNVKRISAFAKRLLQVSLQQPPQYACRCLCLISEVFRARPPLWTMMLQVESADEDLEHFKDMQDDRREITDIASPDSTKSFNSMHGIKRNGGSEDNNLLSGIENGEGPINCIFKGKNSSAGDVLSGVTNETLTSCGREGQVPSIMSSESVKYNPRHREPSYCYAETASWWELILLASHVHPSVATMARTLLSGVNIVYDGNPLNDLSLASFLDKFMKKKPKPNQRSGGIWHGGSQIAPVRKLDMDDHLIGEEMLQVAEDDVPPEDVVFYKFYATKTSQSKRKKKKTLAADEVIDELLPEGSDNSEDEMENMFGLGELPEDKDEDYEYDDLDKVAVEDDNDLLGQDSDTELDSADELEQDADISGVRESEDEIDAGLVDGVFEMEQCKFNKKKRRPQDSPFASIEDYEREKEKYMNMRRKKLKLR